MKRIRDELATVGTSSVELIVMPLAPTLTGGGCHDGRVLAVALNSSLTNPRIRRIHCPQA